MVPRSILSFELCSVADAVCSRASDAISNLAQFSYGKLHSSGENYKVQPQTQFDQWPLTKLHSRSELQSPQYQAQFKHWAESDFRQGVMNNSKRSQLIARLEKDHSALSPQQVRFAIAVIHFYQKDYDDAIAEADRCASGNMLLYSNLLTCHCHIMKRAFPQALADLNRLTALFPDSQLVLDAVDLYHYVADTRQASIAQMKSLLIKNPKNEAALVELAKIYHDLSQLEECLKYCDLALQLSPKDAKLLLLKASILTSQQRYAEALKSLSTILAVDHENGAAYFARAAIYTQQGRWSDAISDLTQAGRLRYALSRTYRARAACYGALKKFDLARQDLRMAKAID
jgi:tetratricopeptide (TPR) repeat protein